MKPSEGRRRIVIEEIQPQVDAGRYPAKRVVGDLVEVTAAIFGDGHDHVAARLLYRHSSQRKWNSVPFSELSNDLWTATFPVDKVGPWNFTVEAWVDHFDTWVHDLGKRLAAQPDPKEPTQQTTPQDIPLALRIGANHLDAASSRAKGGDAKELKLAAGQLRALAEANLPFYESPITAELEALVAKYPDLSFATKYPVELPLWVDRERARFSSWYELFPRSASSVAGRHGTLKDVEARLPEIAAMGFDVVYMPPIHPIGVAFRKGKNNSVTAEPGEEGSPWAIGAVEGGHTEIHPKLGTLADFDDLVKAAQEQGMELALDIAFQCSPDHPWVKQHPAWFVHRPDGTIQYAENPPKKYQDIYPLNFESSDWRGLWDALFGVFKFWVDRGVRVFRVDNPHTKALRFWEWCIAEVQAVAPDALFLAEAFTRPHVMYSLAKGGFTQSYTYFTWRTDKPGLQSYFEELIKPPVSDFFRPNVWPNTPDILHEQLQTGGRPMFMQRVILAATLSANYGIYGPAYELCEGRPAKPTAGKTGSEEYLDSEKYQIREWDRSSPLSIAPLITQLNKIRHESLALQRNESLHFHSCPNPNLLCYSKSTPDFSDTILIAVNLDPLHEQAGIIDLALDKLGLPWQGSFEVEDLLTGARYQWHDQWNYVALNPSVMPAHVFRIVRPQKA
ncbi:alpha-1,4-glucan--maltose-1-phosphate maltosyltransferase [Granulicella mallensis]|uniref:Alpha-1,4-glucan:maltose-1-phosphate maltosyltransferase n=1 Tax=Granulicella mallensis TaxID=940614 RepID=A0A7W8EAQ1_9BACT|nr:alpha-1,4-glucan--maltose-1-phosphate maltosyltransferase [Granulicella mallensis]MBB5064744.1 starch synthase (maltosyl-transferring) [Granulicella mallensis]